MREHHLGNSARGPRVCKDLYWEEDAAWCEAECTFLFTSVDWRSSKAGAVCCPTVDLVDAVGAEALSSTNMGRTLGVCSRGLFAIWRRQRSIFVCAGRLLYKLLSPVAFRGLLLCSSPLKLGFVCLTLFIRQFPRLLLGTNMQVILNVTLWCIKYTKWWYTDINVMPPRSLFFGNTCAQMRKQQKWIFHCGVLCCSGFAQGFVCYYILFWVRRLSPDP